MTLIRVFGFITATITAVSASSAFAACLSLGSTTACSETVEGWADGTAMVPDPPITTSVTFSNITTRPDGDATLSISIVGDFLESDEFFTLTLKNNASTPDYTFPVGGNPGIMLNSNPADDPFDFPDPMSNTNDVGVDFTQSLTGTTTIPDAILTQLLDEGGDSIEFEFSFSVDVADNTFNSNGGSTDESLTITLLFDEQSSVAGVPEPSAIALAGIASLLLGSYYYRRRRS